MADRLRQNTEPSRLSTENPPVSTRKSHLHGLHHSHRPHHSHRSSRHHTKDLIQSAFPSQPPTSFGDLLKQAKESISSSPSDSRRESVAVTDGAAEREARVNGGLHVPPRRVAVRPEDLKREQKRVTLREQELRASLQSLSDQSLKTSRRLDDTYYSILERVAQCRQTISSLQELSNWTNELRESFQAGTTELAEDIEGQLDAFDNFEAQQEQVDKLEDRIRTGKAKAEALGGRLEEARRRVDERKKAEAEEESRNTRHMRIFWGIIVTILGLFLFSTLVQKPKPEHHAPKHHPALDFASRGEILNAPIPDVVKDAIVSPTQTQLDVRIAAPSVKPAAGNDNELRVFDEL